MHQSVVFGWRKEEEKTFCNRYEQYLFGKKCTIENELESELESPFWNRDSVLQGRKNVLQNTRAMQCECYFSVQ